MIAADVVVDPTSYVDHERCVGEDVDHRDAGPAAADVVLERVAVAHLDLALAGLAPQLPPALGELRDAGRADRVALGEQPAGRVHRDAAGERRLALERRDTALALVEEAEVLDVEDLGDREAVVDLGTCRSVDGSTPAIEYARSAAIVVAFRPVKLPFSCRYGWSVATPKPAT